jgi:diguanylate cyclase (GGDEF)-like protein
MAGAMTRAPDGPVPETRSDSSSRLHSNRLLVVPGVLLVVLAGLPWILELVERSWGSPEVGHLRETIEAGVTLLLGAWVLTLIHREQRNARLHLDQLERLSVTDPLTGLGNRRALERELSSRLSRSRRLGEPLALLYLDVDDLKKVNDRFGHAAGDETLKALAAVLRSSSRFGCDQSFRVGGDEFVVLTAADRAGAEAIASRINVSFPERSPRASKVSTGVVVWDGKSNVTELLEEADSRMYRQKRPGPVYQWAS